MKTVLFLQNRWSTVISRLLCGHKKLIICVRLYIASKTVVMKIYEFTPSFIQQIFSQYLPSVSHYELGAAIDKLPKLFLEQSEFGNKDAFFSESVLNSQDFYSRVSAQKW